MSRKLTRTAYDQLVADEYECASRISELEAQLATVTRERDESHSALRDIAQAFRCEPDSHADLVEAARLLVRERDEARADAARLAEGEAAIRDAALEEAAAELGTDATPSPRA